MLKPFLTANWRYLATFNFAVDPEISRASCGVAVTGSSAVVNANGKLGVMASSARFKIAIKPMDQASEAILSLKPVTLSWCNFHCYPNWRSNRIYHGGQRRHQ